MEHATNENGNNLQILRDMVHRQEGEINDNSEKITIETDWREKGDDELNNKIDQVGKIIIVYDLCLAKQRRQATRHFSDSILSYI